MVCRTFMREFIAVGSASGLTKISVARDIHSQQDCCLATAFSICFVKTRLSLRSKLGKPLWSTKLCIDERTFCLNSAKCSLIFFYISIYFYIFCP